MDRYKIIFCLLLGFLNLATPISSSAFSGMILASVDEPVGSCLDYGSGLMNSSGTTDCYPSGWNNPGNVPYLYGKKMYFGGVGTRVWRTFLDNVYPPVSGQYRIRFSFCPTDIPRSTPGCSIATRSQYITSSQPIWLSSSTNMASDSIAFGVTPILRPGVSGTGCVTIVDSLDVEWRFGNNGLVCGDAHALPNIPAKCYINFGEDLNVNLGTLERADIATRPQTTSTVKKQVSVLCTRDAGTTLKMQFQYTPLNIGGQSLVKTSTNGLGIAVSYNGKVMSPTDTVTQTYGVGYTNFDLEFEAVRDPNMKLQEISAGDFTANAVMVMTEQ